MPFFFSCLQDPPGMYPRIFGHEAIGLVLHFLSSDYWHWHCVENHYDYHDKLPKLLKKCELNYFNTNQF